MLRMSDAKEEKDYIQKLMDSDAKLRQQHELFLAEMKFKQELIDTRKNNELTQKDISVRSGLPQQSVSRLEKGKGGTLDTVIRYLSSMGYSLTIKKSRI
ncbi:MAG: XRE family transcriptional regulator [Lachnospira sp.]|nr:XRE family transcriptional regulator [Lachnospira sp.]